LAAEDRLLARIQNYVEVHSFEEMETLPGVAATQLMNRFNQLVVEEIKAFRQEMDAILAKGSSSNDINSFWLVAQNAQAGTGRLAGPDRS
jgi:hypothetical protein